MVEINEVGVGTVMSIIQLQVLCALVEEVLAHQKTHEILKATHQRRSAKSHEAKTRKTREMTRLLLMLLEIQGALTTSKGLRDFQKLKAKDLN